MSGLGSADIGILFFLKKSKNLSLVIISLNFLLNGPTYDTNADANKTSPIITYIFSPKSIIA
jgi:hypothetical protein